MWQENDAPEARLAVDLVALEETPQVLALYRYPDSTDGADSGVVAWVFQLPGDGGVLIFDAEEPTRSMVSCTDLEGVTERWAQLWGAELVCVTSGSPGARGPWTSR